MMVSSYTLITFLVLVLAGGIASIPITYKENSTLCIVHHRHKPLFQSLIWPPRKSGILYSVNNKNNNKQVVASRRIE